MQIAFRVLLSLLPLSLVSAILGRFQSLLYPILIRAGIPLHEIGGYAMALVFAGLLVNPILIFAVMFLIGRRFDVRSNCGGALLSLFIGAVVGLLAGYALFTGAVFLYKAGWVYLMLVTVVTGSLEAIGQALVGFAGLALAYSSQSRT